MKYKNKEEAQNEADRYNRGADYSFASVKFESGYWIVTIKYYS